MCEAIGEPDKAGDEKHLFTGAQVHPQGHGGGSQAFPLGHCL